MAIKTTYVNERGIVFPDQYVRVDEVRAKKNEMVVDAGIYLSQEVAANGGLPHTIEMVTGTFDLDSELNPWQQAYALMKDRWSQSIDV